MQSDIGEHYPFEVQSRAERAARRPKAQKPGASVKPRRYVTAKLRLRWSPMRTSARLKAGFPDDEGMRASHEAIC